MVYVTLITLSYLFGSSRDLCGSAIAENCGSNRISVKGVLCSYYTLRTFLGNGRDGNGSWWVMGHGRWPISVSVYIPPYSLFSALFYYIVNF